MKLYFIISVGIVILIALSPLLSAGFGYNNPSLPSLNRPNLDSLNYINYSTVYVNNSDYLDGYDSSDFWKKDVSENVGSGQKSGSFSISTTGQLKTTGDVSGATSMHTQGLYAYGDDSVGLGLADVGVKSIFPISDNSIDLGWSSYRWRNSVFSGNVTASNSFLNGYIQFNNGARIDSKYEYRFDFIPNISSSSDKFSVFFSDRYGTSTTDLFFQLVSGPNDRWNIFEGYGGAGLIVGTGSSKPLLFYTNRVVKWSIDANGNLISGTDGTSVNNITTAGNIIVKNLNVTGNLNVSGCIHYNGGTLGTCI